MSELVTSWENDDDRLDAMHVESLVRYHTYNNLLGRVLLVLGLVDVKLGGRVASDEHGGAIVLR
jgi:hypothetical protein